MEEQFCPICNTKMHKDRDDSALSRTKKGIVIPVRRTFYVCSKCKTVIWLDRRVDGVTGDAFEKSVERKSDR